MIVSEEKFLNTFENGIKNYRDYNLAKKLHAQKETCKRIANITGRPETTIQGWVKQRKPFGLDALEQAKTLEIIPLTKNSPKLPALYELCSWVFWTGFLTKQYEPRICEKPETIQTLKEYFQKTLQLEGKYAPGTIRFKGNTHGRILNAMGIPAGHRKSTLELHVPQAIIEDTNAQYRFLKILFKTRRSIIKKHWTLYLIENRNEKYAQTLGKEVLHIIKTTLPKLYITEQNLDVETSGERHSPRIRLQKKTILEIEKHYPALIEPDALSPENSYHSTRTA